MECLICSKVFQSKLEKINSDQVFNQFNNLLNLDLKIVNISSLKQPPNKVLCTFCSNELNEIFEVITTFKLLELKIGNFKRSLKEKILSSHQKGINFVSNNTTQFNDVQEIRFRICNELSLFPSDIESEPDDHFIENHDDIQNDDFIIKEENLWTDEIDNSSVVIIDESDQFLNQAPLICNKTIEDDQKMKLEELRKEAAKDQMKIRIKRVEEEYEFSPILDEILNRSNTRSKSSFSGENSVTKRSLGSHLKVRIDKTKSNQAKCPMCGESFSLNTLLIDHIQIHTREKPYTCQDCQQRFQTKYKLFKHERKSHPFDLNKAKSNKKKRTLKCSVCKRCFASISGLKVHMRIIHDIREKVIAQVAHKINMPKISPIRFKDIKDPSNQTVKAIIYECKICDKILKPKNYKPHMLRHENIKQFPCEICGKEFMTHSLMISHLKAHKFEHINKLKIQPHSEKALEALANKNLTSKTDPLVNPFLICDLCGKSIKRSGMLEHLRSHSGIKEFQCDICFKSFSRKTILKYHRRLHTGENHHLCNVCGKNFAYLTSFRIHMESHGEKKFQCSQCDKAYSHYSSLYQHIKSHKEWNHKCEFCNKLFYRKTNLTAHMVRHTKNKPFTCPICYIKFSSSGCFGRHRKNQHNGMKIEPIVDAKAVE